MSWHRAGTVSVTNGSTTVTGVNTAFAANTRVGDAFIGPDGRQYELQNVASDTVISIFPAYIGPTASGQAYVIAPIQGYPKGLCDQVRDWTNQYGGKMAALGTTGNYDILPPAKGGTGRTSVGTVIASDVVASATDTTQGRVLAVGYCGLGARDNAIYAGNNLNPSDYITGGDICGQFNIDGFARTGALITQAGSNSTAASQQFVDWSSGVLFSRGKSGSAWSPWNRLSPEYIENGNGRAVKIQDGTMICWGGSQTLGTINITTGAVFASQQFTLTFPAAFVSEPNTTWGAAGSPNGIAWGVHEWSNNTTTGGRLMGYATGVQAYLRYTAVGRWK